MWPNSRSANGYAHLCYARRCRREDPIIDIRIAQHAVAVADHGASLLVFVKHHMSMIPVGQVATGIKKQVNSYGFVSCSVS